MLPKVAIDGDFAAREIVRNRNARELHDAAFDRVHQRKIADRPREQRALAISGTAEEKWRRGQVEERGDAELALDRLEPSDPKTRRLAVLLGIFPLVGRQFFLAVGFLAVAMM